MLKPGVELGGAKIVRVIGQGNVATVYEAIHKGARRALKVFEGVSVSERVAQEGEALAMIEHINVVRWYDSGLNSERMWIVLELVDGKNLHEIRIAAGGRLRVERALTLVRHACEGLCALHKKGFVHRDMRPENILVTHDDVAKVADLGSVKLPGWGMKTTSAHRLTAMAYMPPELWRGESPDPKNDVYAMGLILYELITGMNPVVPQDMAVPAMCARHLQCEPPPLPTGPEVSGSLSHLVQRAIAKDPAARCTMRELADGLEVALDGLLVWRRAAARSLPLPNRAIGLALTERMPSYTDSAPTPAPAAPISGVGGTIKMAAVAEPTVPAADVREDVRDREAAPPPAPEPSSGPSTLRTPSQLLPVPIVVEPEVARRSTGIPVESSARPSVARPRRWAVGVVAGGGLLVALAVAAWWSWIGVERATPKLAAPPPPPAPTVTASASASAPPAASLPKPPSTPPRRKPPRR